jgi:hypothetical protein
MNFDRIATLAQTLLYEAYLLYPYRGSSVKNRHRWLFGTLYPKRFVETQEEGDRWWTQTECLLRGTDDTVVQVRVRFLHVTESDTVERDVDAPAHRLRDLTVAPQTTEFRFGSVVAQEALKGELALTAMRIGDGLYMLRAVVRNLSPYHDDASSAPDREHRRDRAVWTAFASTHTLLGVANGEFVSLIDPPPALLAPAAACENVGTWPVLVGEPNVCDTMLSAPLILEDYPRLAPESPGDFFDATEIDELLTLRILTLTDEEKQAMRTGDVKGRALLERTEAQDEAQRGRLHGASRLSALAARCTALDAGSRVRLRPRRGGDILDLALAGKTATVVKLEQDYEGRVFVAVTVDDDPGRDLGVEGRPGHRFFFRPDEVEVLE